MFIFISITQCIAQTKDYIAIIPPFHSRQEIGSTESPLQLSHQQFIVFVYQNAVAVYSESDFINQSDNVVDQEFALPSTGHDENGIEPGGRISNGLLSIQLWIEGERVNPQFIQDGNEEWYTIQTKFAPHENHKIKALFWAETSLTDIDSVSGMDTTIIANGQRGFLIDLAHAAIWNSIIESIDVTVILKEGILPNGQTFSAEPTTYDLKDSTLTWSMEYIEPSSNDNIFVSYDSYENLDINMNTIAKLADYIVKKVYDQLLYFVTQSEEL
jgi:hypothetical protein